MLVYFENSVGRLLEHPDGYARVNYNPGKRELGNFQAFLTHTSLLLRRRGWHKLLADQRDMAPFTDEERAWIHDSWLASSASEGYLMYGAVLVPNDVFARLSLSLMMNETRESALTYRLFNSEAEALIWLQSV
jgi:hypothetical protein